MSELYTWEEVLTFRTHEGRGPDTKAGCYWVAHWGFDLNESACGLCRRVIQEWLSDRTEKERES